MRTSWKTSAPSTSRKWLFFQRAPQSGAEELSGRLVELGIKGFWNFSPL